MVNLVTVNLVADAQGKNVMTIINSIPARTNELPDELEYSHLEIATCIVEWLNAVVRSLNGAQRDWYVCVCQNSMMQEDGSSCGIFVIINAIAIVAGGDHAGRRRRGGGGLEEGGVTESMSSPVDTAK